MQYRIDRKTGNRLSILGFGCMRLPQAMGAIDMKKTEQMICTAIEQGVNYFDTAYIYPGSEKALGTVLANNRLRDKVYIATKLPLVLCKNGSDFSRFLQNQLSHLQTEWIDYYMLHMITDFAQWKRLCDWGIREWIADKKTKGEIRQIGFSFHGTRDNFLVVLEDYPWEFCQIQYNYSDINYQAGITGLKRAAEKQIPVIVMEPLLGGKLATSLPAKVEAKFQAENPNLSNAAWALRWLWNQPEVTVVLSGMGAMAQVEDNLATANEAVPEMLTKSELAAIDYATACFQESNKIPCTGCNYCMPCPRGVDIPACFSAYNASYLMGKSKGTSLYTTATGQMNAKQSSASQCVRCGKCEQHCPQNIAIMDALADVKRRLEPLWYKTAMAAARTVLGANRHKR